MSQSVDASDRDALLRHVVRLPVHDEGDDLTLGGGRGRGLGLRRRRARLVDHRRAGLDLRCVGDEVRALRLRHARRDPELADREVRVGLHEHARLGEQGVALAARVLDQVLLQLAEQRGLVPRELLAVARREVEHVLVRDVDARDRDRAVLVHLLGELAGELDRLDVRLEGTAEHPLEEGLELLFE